MDNNTNIIPLITDDVLKQVKRIAEELDPKLQAREKFQGSDHYMWNRRFFEGALYVLNRLEELQELRANPDSQSGGTKTYKSFLNNNS